MPDRQLLAPAYPDDTGEAEPALTTALAAHAADPRSLPTALAALQTARVLVPVVAVAGEVELDEHGLAHDKTSDMAAVLVQRPGGRRGLLAFSGSDTMAAWDPAARPVPVSARTAALAAIQDGAEALLLDLAGPAPLVVEGDHLRALAAGWRLVRIGSDLGWVDPAALTAPD
ncbi:SseB family protein [Nocardioides sp.]|uniref:SseB family protein n=1 Tax=Nocardioides sp. TaxID=35761 RepID=UPI00271BEE5E|nr:SseB family protein [Nocardioides sp.]MDO9454855.1 SseB family protein [Nocardioides sp.]